LHIAFDLGRKSACLGIAFDLGRKSACLGIVFGQVCVLGLVSSGLGLGLEP